MRSLTERESSRNENSVRESEFAGGFPGAESGHWAGTLAGFGGLGQAEQPTLAFVKRFIAWFTSYDQ